MLYVLDKTAEPGLVVVATDDNNVATDILARYQVETGHECVIASDDFSRQPGAAAMRIVDPGTTIGGLSTAG